jgi:3-isopropylmalate/(R)-2-methylmalate dehydratase small subunit
VVATSFARSFYRNAVNNGLLPVECDTSGIAEGDDLIITPRDLSMEITNVTRGIVIRGAALPAIMADILHAGGLVGYIRRHGGFRDPRPHAIGH